MSTQAILINTLQYDLKKDDDQNEINLPLLNDELEPKPGGVINT